MPASIRKELGIKPGPTETFSGSWRWDTTSPVEFYSTIKLNDSGLLKLKEARDSGTSKLPDWFEEERSHAGIDSE